MKTLISKGWAFAAAVAAIVSCTKNVEEEKPSINEGPKFPEKQQIEIPAGEQKVLTFTAEADWKLVIDKTTWCAFIDNGVETAQISGKAGEVNATVAVKDNGLDFTSDVAKIDLTLDTKTETIYEITRPGKAREIKLYAAIGYGAEYAECKAIELSADEQVSFTIVANYDWTAAAPEGFKFQSKDYTEIPGLSGTAGVGPEDKDFNYATIIVADETIPYEKNAKIVVTDTEGKNPVEFPLHYSGMDENALEMDITSMIMMQGLNFTADGFVINKTMDFSEVTGDKDFTIPVTAKNMEYTVYPLAIEEGKAVELGTSSWVKIADDSKGQVKISVTENTSEERTGYVLILPEALAKNFDKSSFTDEWGNVNHDYDGKYIKVIQKGVTVTRDFMVQWGSLDMKRMTTVPFNKDDFDGMTISEMSYGSCEDNAYVVEITEDDVLVTYDGSRYYSTGALKIAPVGFPDDYYPVGASEDDNLFRFIGQRGNWNTSYVGSTSPLYTSQGSINGIQIAPEQFIDTETNTSKNFQGMAIVQFYKTAEDKAANKSSATLVIVKK